jgi:hypothetical protein
MTHFNPDESRNTHGEWSAGGDALLNRMVAEKVSSDVGKTASNVKTGREARLGTEVRADRVTQDLKLAASALRNGDRDNALMMLERARSDVTGGTASQRLPHVAAKDGKTLLASIDKHIADIKHSEQMEKPGKVKKISAAESRRRRAAGET